MAKKVKIKRFQIGLNVLIQMVTVLALVVLANYFAFRHFQRWDFSRSQKYSLSEQTRQVLGTLKEGVKFIVFFAPDARVPGADLHDDVENLVKEYQYASDGKISVEYVDPFRDLSRARELLAKYKFGVENVVVVDYDGRSKVVNAADMAEYDNSGMLQGQAPTLKSFSGEQAITNALLEVSETKRNVVRFLQGQGEPEIGGGSLSTLRTYLQRQNLDIQTTNLLEVPEIPAGEQVVVMLGPQYDLSNREIELLRQYWEAQGRLIIALEPTAATPKLNAFIASLGVVPQDDRVEATVTISPGLTGIVNTAVAAFVPGLPITTKVGGITTRLAGASQSLALQTVTAQASGIKLQPVLQAVEGFWGETEYSGGPEAPVYFDPQKDHGPPLVIGAVAEKGGVADARMQVQNARALIVGNAGFLGDQSMSEANLDFFLNTVNWMIDRSEMIGIAPKTPTMFSLNLDQDIIGRIATIVMLIIPVGAAALGILVWAVRRR